MSGCQCHTYINIAPVTCELSGLRCFTAFASLALYVTTSILSYTLTTVRMRVIRGTTLYLSGVGAGTNSICFTSCTRTSQTQCHRIQLPHCKGRQYCRLSHAPDSNTVAAMADTALPSVPAVPPLHPGLVCRTYGRCHVACATARACHAKQWEANLSRRILERVLLHDHVAGPFHRAIHSTTAFGPHLPWGFIRL